MSKSETTILLADDHYLIRNGLKQVLESEGNFEILEVDNGEKALRHIRENTPQMAILDIEMPGMTGFEVAKTVHRERIKLDIIFLTMYRDNSMFNKAMDIGVKGYVLKENTVTEIIACLNAVRKGQTYLSPAISDLLVQWNKKQKKQVPPDIDGLDQLTASERAILKMISDMKTNQELADELKITISTVQNHRNNMCKKLNLNGRHALLKFAIEHADRI